MSNKPRIVDTLLSNRTNKVLWKLELTLSKNIFPQILAIEGNRSAPHKTLVADTGSLMGGTSGDCVLSSSM